MSKSILLITVLGALAFSPFCTSFNLGFNSNANAGAVGRVCATFLPGASTAQTVCTENCPFDNRFACAQNLLNGLGLTQICSANTTNSTIPAGTCVVCRTAANVVTTCTGASVIANNAMITDAQFRCLEQMCAQTIEFYYEGFVAAQKSKTFRLPFAGPGAFNLGALGKRSADSSAAMKIPFRQWFDADLTSLATVHVVVEEE